MGQSRNFLASWRCCAKPGWCRTARRQKGLLRTAARPSGEPGPPCSRPPPSRGDLPAVLEVAESSTDPAEARRVSRSTQSHSRPPAKNYCPGRSGKRSVTWRCASPGDHHRRLGAGEGLVRSCWPTGQAGVVHRTIPADDRGGAPTGQRNGLPTDLQARDIEEVPCPTVRSIWDPQPGAAPCAAPQTAINRSLRSLRPAGPILILDLNEHTFDGPRLCDVWLGSRSARSILPAARRLRPNRSDDLGPGTTEPNSNPFPASDQFRPRPLVSVERNDPPQSRPTEPACGGQDAAPQSATPHRANVIRLRHHPDRDVEAVVVQFRCWCR